MSTAMTERKAIFESVSQLLARKPRPIRRRKVFDMVYSLTNGGPGFATEVMYTGVYKEFGLGRYAVGTTLSTVMTLVMLVAGYFMIKHMVKGDGQEI